MIKFFSRPILAIETSCDETSAAIVAGKEILASIVASQVDLHAKWGGIVPEAAARAHVEAILPVIAEALDASSLSLRDLGGIAVTNRPGLVGALSVGVSAAKALAFAFDLPLIGVHHLEGHVLSPLGLGIDLPFPHVCLAVSGGHTEIIHVLRPFGYVLLGQTIDDAAGEAFDKGARLLGLGYPGGPAIQDAAVGGNGKRYLLPKGLSGDTLDFSFSGLKTAILRLVEAEGPRLSLNDAAASVQEAIVGVLAERAVRAAESVQAAALTVVGGVAANAALRERLADGADRAGIPFLAPPIELCTDNAAMIGLVGSLRLARGERSDDDLDVLPNAPLPS